MRSSGRSARPIQEPLLRRERLRDPHVDLVGPLLFRNVLTKRRVLNDDVVSARNRLGRVTGLEKILLKEKNGGLELVEPVAIEDNVNFDGVDGEPRTCPPSAGSPGTESSPVPSIEDADSPPSFRASRRDAAGSAESEASSS